MKVLLNELLSGPTSDRWFLAAAILVSAMLLTIWVVAS
jgi:hypothetical protein